jgi:hypothetical protein
LIVVDIHILHLTSKEYKRKFMLCETRLCALFSLKFLLIIFVYILELVPLAVNLEFTFASFRVALCNPLPQYSILFSNVLDSANLEIMREIDFSGKNHYLLLQTDHPKYEKSMYSVCYGVFTTSKLPYIGKTPEVHWWFA